MKRRGYTVDESGCWVWQGHLSKDGYGRVERAGRGQQLAHRWHYEERHGAVPDGLELDHLCRNRACVNPDHLEPVTRTVNMRRGAATKLTATQIEEIRSSRDTQTAVAARLGITQSYVSKIRRGVNRV